MTAANSMIMNNTPQSYNAFFQPSTVETLQERMELENLTPEIPLHDRGIEEYSISRLSFQLTGFFDFFPYKRVQIIGKNEYEYMKTLDEAVLTERLERICSYQLPCIIISRNLTVEEILIRVCRAHKIPLLRSKKETLDVESEVVKILRVLLAPKQTIHGVLVDVYGVGVLIRGDSGIGKSEAALELVKRGHRLVSDDVVEIRKVSDETLVGIAPDLTRDFIEVRGIGIINIRALFGFEAVKGSQNIDMVVNLEEFQDKKTYDRLGLEPQYDEIMGNQVYKVDIPVRPGRNLAGIVEAAAINYRAKIMGYDAPRVFMERLNKIKTDRIEKSNGCV